MFLLMVMPGTSAGDYQMGDKVAEHKHAHYSKAIAGTGGAYGFTVGIEWSEKGEHGAAFAMCQIPDMEEYPVPGPYGSTVYQKYVQDIKHDWTQDTERCDPFGATDHKWYVDFDKGDDLDPVDVYRIGEYKYHSESGRAYMRHYTRDWGLFGGDWEHEGTYARYFTLELRIHLVGQMI
ncbi:MAG: hypothetical protein R6W73_06220 [Candidatus Saliniplasma sp.]